MAETLAEAISQFLPNGYEVREERGEITLLREGKLEGGMGVAASYFYSPADDGFAEPERREDDEFVRDCAEALLDRVQDWITENRTWPWPPVPGRSTVMPDYHAEVEARVLRVWYAADGIPVTPVVAIALPDWAADAL